MNSKRMIKIKYIELRKLKKILSFDSYQSATLFALKRAGQDGAVEAKRQIKKRYTIKPAYLNRFVFATKPDRATMSTDIKAVVSSDRKKGVIPLFQFDVQRQVTKEYGGMKKSRIVAVTKRRYYYKPKGHEVVRLYTRVRTDKGWHMWGGRIFVQKMHSGHIGIFRGFPHTRYIKEILSVSLPSMMRNRGVIEATKLFAKEKFSMHLRFAVSKFFTGPS